MNMFKYFELTGVAWISKTTYYSLQKKYLLGVANEALQKEHSSAIADLKTQGECYFSGNGRCYSPGHNGKYLTY